MKSKVLMILFFLTGCGSFVKNYESELKKRASFDLKCSQEKLKVTELDFYTAGVEGCGKQSTYIKQYETSPWIMNTDTKNSKKD